MALSVYPKEISMHLDLFEEEEKKIIFENSNQNNLRSSLDRKSTISLNTIALQTNVKRVSIAFR
jgi:hypothetical protein